MKTSYIWDSGTGEYKGTGKYPLNHKKEPILAKYETLTKPPDVGTNKVARYLKPNGDIATHHEQGSWEKHDDYRGTVHYAPDGKKHEITTLNENVPEGNITFPPPSEHYKEHNGTDWIYDSSTHVQKIVDSIKDLESQKYNIFFSYKEKDWQVDEDSQRKINAWATKALFSIQDPVKFPWGAIKWKTADNIGIEFSTPSEFMEFAEAVANHCQAIWQKASDHKNAVRGLTKEEDLNKYDITKGW